MEREQSLDSPRHRRLTQSNFSKVPSLLFDLELDDDRGSASQQQFDDSSMMELYDILEPSSPDEEMLRVHVEVVLQQCEMLDSSSEDYQQIASRLGKLGYTVRVRTALGGGVGGECLRNLRHTFLSLYHNGRSFVVDRAFKDQFVIAKPTPKYAAFLERLPMVQASEESSIACLVHFLCAAMAEAFETNGSVLPPWRRAESMLSKWLPRKSMDERVESWKGQEITAKGKESEAQKPECGVRIKAQGTPNPIAAYPAAVVMSPGKRAKHLLGVDAGPKKDAGALAGNTVTVHCNKSRYFEPRCMVAGGSFGGGD